MMKTKCWFVQEWRSCRNWIGRWRRRVRVLVGGRQLHHPFVSTARPYLCIGNSAVSRWILMCFKEVSPVLSSHPSLPLIVSPPRLLRAADPRGVGALRRARRSHSSGPRWPLTRGTALPRRPVQASSSPSEGRTPRACSWNTALFSNFQQERERGRCWWCARDGGFPFCASVDWCTSVIRAALMPKKVTDAILDIAYILLPQTKRYITMNRPVCVCLYYSFGYFMVSI